MEEMTPHDLIREYPPLQGIVEALAELATFNRQTVQSVIELAMVYGIYAANRRRDNEEKGNAFVVYDGGFSPRW